MSKPITSRVKRSPLFKYNAPLKQTNPLGKSVKVGGSEEGKDETIETEVKTPKKTLQKAYKDRSAEYKDLSFEEYSKKAKADPLYGTSGGTKKVSKTVKGDDLDYDTTLMQSNEGRILEPWEQSRLSRTTKGVNRDVRRSKIKLGKAKRKLARMEKRGKTSGSRYERLKAKEEENTSELKAFKSAAANTQLAMESGRKQGETYRKADTEVTQGQRTPDQQLSDAKRAAKKAAKKEAKDKAAKAQGVTKDEGGQGINETSGSQGVNVGDTASINLDGVFGQGLDLYQTSNYTPLAMTKKGYNMKAKSPATKSASGKFKSALKKGYFKSK